MVVFAAPGLLPFLRVLDLTGGYSTAILVFLALPVAFAIAAHRARPHTGYIRAPVTARTG